MGKYTSVAAAVSSTLSASWWIWKWASLFGLGGIIWSFSVQDPLFRTFCLIVFAQILTVGTGLALYFWVMNSNRKADAMNPLLKVTRFVSTYYVGPGGSYRLVQEVEVCAKRLGPDRYVSKHKWTGDGECAVSVEPDTFKLLPAEMDNEGFFIANSVQFERKLRAGERRSFTLTRHINDNAGTPRPYLIKTVDDDYPNGFSQRVVLPAVPKSYSVQVYRSAHSQIPLEERNELAPDSREIIQRVRHAAFDRRYVVRWLA